VAFGSDLTSLRKSTTFAEVSSIEGCGIVTSMVLVVDVDRRYESVTIKFIYIVVEGSFPPGSLYEIELF